MEENDSLNEDGLFTRIIPPIEDRNAAGANDEITIDPSLYTLPKNIGIDRSTSNPNGTINLSHMAVGQAIAFKQWEKQKEQEEKDAELARQLAEQQLSSGKKGRARGKGKDHRSASTTTVTTSSTAAAAGGRSIEEKDRRLAEKIARKEEERAARKKEERLRKKAAAKAKDKSHQRHKPSKIKDSTEFKPPPPPGRPDGEVKPPPRTVSAGASVEKDAELAAKLQAKELERIERRRKKKDMNK